MFPVNVLKLLYRTVVLKIGRVESDPTADYNMAAATYDDYYSRYLGQSSQELINRMPLASGMTILDLACGTGFFSHRIAEKIGRRGELTAVDLSAGMLAKNRDNVFADGLRNIHFVEADAIEFLRTRKDSSVDGVVCGWGVCYMDHDAFRVEVERVVCPGGFLGIIENRANTLKAVSDLFRAAMMRYPEALVKNMVINLPKDHRYLLKTFCKGAFQPVDAWNGALSVPCRNGSDIADYMMKSGASAGFLNALDEKKVDQVMQQFIQAADKRFQIEGNVPVKHEYCALLAIKRRDGGLELARELQ